jgi:hypothetical protein
VVNAGTIERLGASRSYGIEFSANTGGGNVTNQSGGAISGINGAEITNHAVLVNAGTIRGNATTGEGVLFGTGGNVTNQAGGEISGAFGVRLVGAAGTVMNAGTITGSRDAVYLHAGYANRLVIDPGAVFSGQVTGGNAIGAAHVSTLELASVG